MPGWFQFTLPGLDAFAHPILTKPPAPNSGVALRRRQIPPLRPGAIRNPLTFNAKSEKIPKLDLTHARAYPPGIGRKDSQRRREDNPAHG